MASHAALIVEHGRAPEVREHERAVPPGATIIDVAAAPITPLDLLCASGTSYFGAPDLPYVPGVQGVGTVAESAAFATGTPVWFATSAGMAPGDGSMSHLCVADGVDVVPLPVESDLPLVAALGLSAVAAWLALTWRGALQSGETVIVLGAGGVVGKVAVQAARISGAARIVAACRFAHAADRARELGADEVVLLDTDDADELAGRFAAATDGGADLVLDPLFGTPAVAALRTLRPHGRLVNLGSSAAPTAVFDSSTLRSRSLRVLGYTNNEISVDQRADALKRIVALAIEGRLTVDYDRVKLTDIAEAWTRQLAGTAPRRIVVTM